MFKLATFATSFALASAAAISSSVPTAPPMGVYQTDAAVPAVTATTVVPSSSATAVAKRDATTCLAQPTGIAHTSTPDSADGFLADSYYSNAALSAVTPSGYSSVFINTTASSNTDSYMGFTLLTTYDVQSCATQCSAITGCKSFNVYFERDPSVDPNDSSCLNPSSVTQIKCVWWGSAISTAVNVNNGQWRGDFHVVIAGSNGYARDAVSATTSATSSAVTSTKSASSTLATVVRVASTSTTSAAATSTTSAAAKSTATAFNIKVDWTGTSVDGKFIQVSKNGYVGLVNSASSGTKFIYDSNNNLVNTATGALANVPARGGNWQSLQFSSASKGFSFASCSTVSPYVQCTLEGTFEYAGVCNNDGKLYFGLPERMPAGCQWAGLFPVALSS